MNTEIYNGKDIVYTVDALNEISVGGINRTVYLSVAFYFNENLKMMSKIIGDGAIFATSTGSTAYNVNAGGSVLLIDDAFSVVANNAVFETSELPQNTKSLVVSSDFKFCIEILHNHKKSLPYVIADGQRTYRLKNNDRIEISKSLRKIKLII